MKLAACDSYSNISVQRILNAVVTQILKERSSQDHNPNLAAAKFAVKLPESINFGQFPVRHLPQLKSQISTAVNRTPCIKLVQLIKPYACSGIKTRMP